MTLFSVSVGTIRDEERYRRKNTREIWSRRKKSMCEAWQDFNVFFEFMGLVPHGMKLYQADASLPYQPGNAFWRTPEEHQRRRKVTISS